MNFDIVEPEKKRGSLELFFFFFGVQIWLKFAIFLGEISPNFRYHKIDWKKNLDQDAKIHHKIEDEMRITLRTTLMCAVQKLSFWMKMNLCMDDLMEEIGKWDEDRSLHGWDSLYVDELLACLDGCPFSLNPNSSRACAGATLHRHRETERERARETERGRERAGLCVSLCGCALICFHSSLTSTYFTRIASCFHGKGSSFLLRDRQEGQRLAFSDHFHRNLYWLLVASWVCSFLYLFLCGFSMCTSFLFFVRVASRGWGACVCSSFLCLRVSMFLEGKRG